MGLYRMLNVFKFIIKRTENKGRCEVRVHFMDELVEHLPFYRREEKDVLRK
jgi:hypothetical protein